MTAEERADMERMDWLWEKMDAIRDALEALGFEVSADYRDDGEAIRLCFMTADDLTRFNAIVRWPDFDHKDDWGEFDSIDRPEADPNGVFVPRCDLRLVLERLVSRPSPSPAAGRPARPARRPPMPIRRANGPATRAKRLGRPT